MSRKLKRSQTTRAVDGPANPDLSPNPGQPQSALDNLPKKPSTPPTPDPVPPGKQAITPTTTPEQATTPGKPPAKGKPPVPESKVRETMKQHGVSDADIEEIVKRLAEVGRVKLGA